MKKARKLLALSFATMLLLMGCYIGMNSTVKAESTVEFPYSTSFSYSYLSIGLDIYFDFSVDHTDPSLLFGGTDSMYIDVQPDSTTFSIQIGWGSSSKTFTETISYAPIGEYTFRIPVTEIPLIEAVLIGVSANPWVIFQPTGGLGVQADYVDSYGNPCDIWLDAGRQSCQVTAPSGIGTSTIREYWYYAWSLRLGIDVLVLGDLWTPWYNLGSLEGTVLNISVSYGYGFLFLFFILIIIAIVVVIVVVKKKKKAVTPTPTPPPMEEPITPVAVTPDTVEKPYITEIKEEGTCPNCGSEVEPGLAFCPNCGTKF